MAFLTGDNTPLPVSTEALVLTGSAVFATGNAATSATIALGSLTPSGISSYAFDAKNAVIAIANNGSGQTINAATLSFVDTLGTQNVVVSYTIPSVSIANNANATFQIPLPSGLLRNAQLAVTFASAPTAGSVAVEAVLQSEGGELSPIAGDSIAFSSLPASVQMVQTGTSLASSKRVITKFVQIQAQAITHATPVSVYTPTSGKKFRILGYNLSTTVAASIQFEDTTGVEVLRTPLLLASTPFASGDMGNGYLSTAANNQIFLDVTVTGNVSGWIGIEEE